MGTERLPLRVGRVLAGQLDDIEVQELGQPALERERLGEVVPGFQEQHRHVRPDPRRHVHHAGPLGLERGGERELAQAGLLERPAHDLAGVRRFETGVERAERFVGEQGVGHRASVVGVQGV